MCIYCIKLYLNKNSYQYTSYITLISWLTEKGKFNAAFTFLIMNHINPIPRVDTHLFINCSNIVFPSTPRLF